MRAKVECELTISAVLSFFLRFLSSQNAKQQIKVGSSVVGLGTFTTVAGSQRRIKGGHGEQGMTQDSICFSQYFSHRRLSCRALSVFLISNFEYSKFD
ncbi:hypothetical protein B0H19DRAFT_512963 [Mycena capillaripes]|nr:hypothetical protein B0H19DRAFT_512963 [Mycena capillaripes]